MLTNKVKKRIAYLLKVKHSPKKVELSKEVKPTIVKMIVKEVEKEKEANNLLVPQKTYTSSIIVLPSLSKKEKKLLEDEKSFNEFLELLGRGEKEIKVFPKREVPSRLENIVPKDLKWRRFCRETRKLTKLQDIDSLPLSDKERVTKYSQFNSSTHYVIDHKISIYWGYQNGMTSIDLASLCNLRWITGKENTIKGVKNYIDAENEHLFPIVNVT